MNITIVWTLLAVAAIVAEMMTGTLYLLVLGAAAAAGALASWLGWGFAVECLVAAAVMVAGSLSVRRWRPRTGQGMPDDVQGNAEVASREANGQIRVRWRGTEWDARVDGASTNEGFLPGDKVVLLRKEGNLLVVSRA
jgi:membrane protein implicated in regulation of membrane protease activity